MEHSQATEEVINLIPKMASTSPEEVLVNRAIEKRWAPAQLHKIAQVYNTCSTLHAQKQDRNSIPALVDAPAVVQQYVERSGRSKLKAASSFMREPSSEEPALEKAASAEPENMEETPYVWNEEPLKIAAQEREVDPIVLRRWKMEDFKKAATQLIDRVDEIIDTRFEYNKTLDKCASQVKEVAGRDGLDMFSKLERDCRAMGDPLVVKNAFDLLEESSKRAGMEVRRFDPDKHIDSVIGRDTTGLASVADTIHNSFSKFACSLAGLEDDLAELVKKSSELPDDGDRHAGIMMDRVKGKLDELEALFKFASSVRQQAAGGNPSSVRRTSAGGSMDVLDQAVRQVEEASDAMAAEDASANAAIALGDLALRSPGRAAEAVTDTLAPAGRAIYDLGSRDGQLAKLLKNRSKDYQDDTTKLISDLETNEKDVRSTANLKKLLITDEVLSQADPFTVVEAFNSIRAAAPEVATDISMLRLQLRQAVTHQGYDIDSASAARKFEKSRTAKREPEEA